MYNKLLIAIDLSDLESAKYVVDTCLDLTAKNPNAVYRVVTIIEPVDDSFISAFLPKNFDKSVVEEANKALHEFTQAHFPAGSKVSKAYKKDDVLVKYIKNGPAEFLVCAASKKHKSPKVYVYDSKQGGLKANPETATVTASEVADGDLTSKGCAVAATP